MQLIVLFYDLLAVAPTGDDCCEPDQSQQLLANVTDLQSRSCIQLLQTIVTCTWVPARKSDGYPGRILKYFDTSPFNPHMEENVVPNAFIAYTAAMRWQVPSPIHQYHSSSERHRDNARHQ
jgi:hypothetical protein